MNAFIRLSLSLIGISLLTACGEEIDHNDIRQAGFVFVGKVNQQHLTSAYRQWYYSRGVKPSVVRHLTHA